MDFDTFWRRLRRTRTAEDRGLVILHRIASSHDLARRAAKEYQAEGHQAPSSDFLAWQQTAGKGRHGRPWRSPAGAGVYASMVRQLSTSQARALPLTVPTALATALREDAGVDCGVKWPNDLMVEGKKIGGILIDVVTSGSADPIAVVSFGVNHGASALFKESRAISVAERGSPLSLDELAALLLDRVDCALREIEGVADVLAAYRELSIHQPGDELACRLDQGAPGGSGDDSGERGSEDRRGDGSAQVTRGMFLGIDDDGLLRLEVDGAERRLSTGRLLES